MKFITEYDLRELYKTNPFTSYIIETGTKLTPGARQFLADRGICIADTQNKAKQNCSKVNDLKNKNLFARINSIEASILLSSQELLAADVWLARAVLDLSRKFADIANILSGKLPAESLECNKCSCINSENFCQDLGDCFNISSLDIKLEKARYILLLHQVRCTIREFSIDLMERYEEQEDENCNAALIRITQIINILSQMICATLGGKECLRKS